MALQFETPGGEIWQMGNISAPVFGAATPEQLMGRLQSLALDPETKRPNADKVKAFADANPRCCSRVVTSPANRCRPATPS